MGEMKFSSESIRTLRSFLESIPDSRSGNQFPGVGSRIGSRIGPGIGISSEIGSKIRIGFKIGVGFGISIRKHVWLQ